MPSAVSGSDGVLLQYNPFLYGRRGIAPWLPRALRAIRAQGRPIGIMVHEGWLAPATLRQRVLTVWQREQMRAMLRYAHVAFTSTAALGRQLVDLESKDTVVQHLPVSSNLPDQRAQRASARARLNIGREQVVLVAFGTGHSSQRQDWVALAARAASEVADVAVLNLGSGAGPLPGLPHGLRTVTPGRQSPDELASMMSCGDLFIAPFVDGVSTRRTTVMAAAQHGLPVLGTLGTNTDDVFLGADGFWLVDAADPHDLCVATRILTADRAERERRGLAARRQFEADFSWPSIASRVATVFHDLSS